MQTDETVSPTFDEKLALAVAATRTKPLDDCDKFADRAYAELERICSRIRTEIGVPEVFDIRSGSPLAKHWDVTYFMSQSDDCLIIIFDYDEEEAEQSLDDEMEYVRDEEVSDDDVKWPQVISFSSNSIVLV